jgi:periplasmic divalent cation tolerance protein
VLLRRAEEYFSHQGSPMKFLFVYITAKDKAQARAIGTTLVTEKLAACVNILAPMNSFYFWKGKLSDDSEAVLIAKTRDTLFRRLVKRVKELHSYEIPCIVALPIVGGNKEFLQWMEKETAVSNKK